MFSLLLLSLLVGPSLALESGLGFGDPLQDTDWSTWSWPTVQSAPVSISNAIFRLAVDVRSSQGSNLSIEGVDAGQAVVYARYLLLFDGTLNTTFREGRDLTDDEQPQFCASTLAGLYSTKETNSFGEDDVAEDSCQDVLGQECVNQLWRTEGSNDTGTCNSPPISQDCQDKFPPGPWLTQCKSYNQLACRCPWRVGDEQYRARTKRPLTRADLLRNETQRSPIYFMHQANITEGGSEAENGTYVPSEAEETALTIARDRLYLVVLSDRRGYYPVCVRPNIIQLDKDSPASGAERVGWSSGAVLLSVALTWALI